MNVNNRHLINIEKWAWMNLILLMIIKTNNKLWVF